MMDCLTCPKNNPKESFCFDKEECSVPFAMVRDGKIIAWEENKEDKKMRCADCGFYECCMRTPLGGCPNGEKADPSRIYTTPNTGHGPWEKDYQPSGVPTKCELELEKKRISVYDLGRGGVGIMQTEYKKLSEAALALVDAVERYTMGKCLRSELLIKNNELKKLL